MDILNVIILIICTMTGVVVGWIWGNMAGFRVGFRKATNEAIEFVGRLYPITNKACTQCGAIIPDHFHGCIIAAEFKLVTIAKPGG